MKINFHAVMYDSAGNETKLKSGHAMLIGKDCMQEVKVSEYAADFVYRKPDGSMQTVDFPVRQGEDNG